MGPIQSQLNSNAFDFKCDTDMLSQRDDSSHDEPTFILCLVSRQRLSSFISFTLYQINEWCISITFTLSHEIATDIQWKHFPMIVWFSSFSLTSCFKHTFHITLRFRRSYCDTEVCLALSASLSLARTGALHLERQTI